MAKSSAPTTVPRVPLQTPMFEPSTDANTDTFEQNWKLTRTWIIFFERIWKGNTASTAKAGLPGPFQRTLLLRDLKVGIGIADNTTVWTPGKALWVTCNLKKPLTLRLIVEIWKLDITNTSLGFQKMIQMIVPQAHAVNLPMDFTGFTTNALKQMHDGDVLRWDTIESDLQTDPDGVASFTLKWQ